MPGRFGEPSTPSQTAADPPLGRQPGGRPLGYATGAPSRTQFMRLRIGRTPLRIVPDTRENRFVTLVAPFVNFSIYIGEANGVNALSGFALPVGQPFEVTLPGNQALWAVTDAPVLLDLQIQIAPAIASDTERRL